MLSARSFLTPTQIQTPSIYRVSAFFPTLRIHIIGSDPPHIHGDPQIRKQILLAMHVLSSLSCAPPVLASERRAQSWKYGVREEEKGKNPTLSFDHIGNKIKFTLN